MSGLVKDVLDVVNQRTDFTGLLAIISEYLISQMIALK